MLLTFLNLKLHHRLNELNQVCVLTKLIRNLQLVLITRLPDPFPRVFSKWTLCKTHCSTYQRIYLRGHNLASFNNTKSCF
jgi:hypothetical protein